MKKLLFILLLLSFGCVNNNQMEITRNNIERYGDSIKFVEHQLDSIENSRKINVLKIEGDTFTNLEYKSLYQLKKKTKEEALKDSWDNERLFSKLIELEFNCEGGLLILRIERKTKSEANTNWFTISIKDINEKELYNTALSNSNPETKSMSGYWWNVISIPISKKIVPPYYVYVNEFGSKNKIKFEVK